jgi:hypothetical protein
LQEKLKSVLLSQNGLEIGRFRLITGGFAVASGWKLKQHLFGKGLCCRAFHGLHGIIVLWFTGAGRDTRGEKG